MLDECDEMLNMGFVDDVEKARPFLICFLELFCCVPDVRFVAK